MKRLTWIGIIAAVLAVFLLAAYEAQSQKEGEPRVAQVIDIMTGIQKPNMTKLSTASKKAAPSTDKEWKELQTGAALLNETGFILTEAGRTKDDVWTKACADLRAAAAGAAKAVEEKNFDAFKAQVPKIGAACQSCHDAHQK